MLKSQHVRSRLYRWSPLAFALILSYLIFATQVWAGPYKPNPAWQSPGCGLHREFIGQNPWSPLYPELQANYWTFGWQAEDLVPGQALRIQGTYPELRYFSWSLYDGATGDVLTHLNDEQIQLEPSASGDEQDQKRYTIWILPEGGSIPTQGRSLIVPSGIRQPVLVLRYYEERAAKNHYGNALLPQIDRILLASGDVMACPSPLGFKLPLGNLGPALKAVWDTKKMKDPAIRFYRVKGAGMYPNPDNSYVSTRLFMSDYGDTAILKVRLPAAEAIGKGGLIRYQSFCIGSFVSTLTPKEACVMDQALPRDAEGWTFLVISDRPEVRAKAEGLGYASLVRGTRFPLVLMRQMLARDGFEGSLHRVPMTEGSGDVEGKAADLYVGDYGPRGYYCSGERFLEQGVSCGA